MYLLFVKSESYAQDAGWRNHYWVQNDILFKIIIKQLSLNWDQKYMEEKRLSSAVYFCQNVPLRETLIWTYSICGLFEE